MKHSDAIKATMLATINEIAANPVMYAVNPGKDFTRNRKMSFNDTILMLLTMEADCIKEELYRYFGRNPNAPSKTAFYNQRKKLNEQALANLFHLFNSRLSKNLYKDKYRLIACDGSAVDIFRNPDDPDTFFEPNGKSSRGFNQVHINAFYSILDRRFTNLVIQPGRKRNEYSAFCEMVDAAGSKELPTIYLADMGYASYNNFAHVIENRQFFLIRCNDKRLKGILGRPIENLKEVNCHVDRILTRTQSEKNATGRICRILTGLYAKLVLWITWMTPIRSTISLFELFVSRSSLVRLKTSSRISRTLNSVLRILRIFTT